MPFVRRLPRLKTDVTDECRRAEDDGTGCAAADSDGVVVLVYTSAWELLSFTSQV